MQAPSYPYSGEFSHLSSSGSSMMYSAPSPGLVGSDTSARAPAMAASSAPSTESVKEQLWHVFTFYAMMDNALDPAHMTRHQLQKCARDARLVPPLLDADIENIWMAEVNREGKNIAAFDKPHNVLKQAPVRAAPARHDEPSRRSSDRRQLNFEDFCNVLKKMSERIFAAHLHSDEPFLRLVFERVLPFAKRRVHYDISPILADPSVSTLFMFFADPLIKIFGFYASHDRRVAARLLKAASNGSNSGGQGKGISHVGQSHVRSTKSVNLMKGALSYPDYLEFFANFDIAPSPALTNIKICDIYLSSARGVAADAALPALTFEGFWEALVRASIEAFSSELNSEPIVDKIKAMMQAIARGTSKIDRAWADSRPRNANTDAHDLIQGSQDFRKHFDEMWRADLKRDYSIPPPVVVERGLATLERLGSSGFMPVQSYSSFLPPPPPPPDESYKSAIAAYLSPTINSAENRRPF